MPSPIKKNRFLQKKGNGEGKGNFHPKITPYSFSNLPYRGKGRAKPPGFRRGLIKLPTKMYHQK
jgi:hypothetical protein